MLVRAFLLALIGTCLVAAPGCGETKVPQPPVVSNIPGSETAASRQFMRPEYMQGFDKNGNLILKPGMKPPASIKLDAAPKP